MSCLSRCPHFRVSCILLDLVMDVFTLMLTYTGTVFLSGDRGSVSSAGH